MAIEKGKTKNPLVSYSWGILLGMSGIPVLALLSKLLPGQNILWAALATLCVLVVLRSGFGYAVTPANPTRKNHQAAH
jgi:hypothetical protein